MSRDQTLGVLQLTHPEWCADFLGRDQLLPGGVKLDAAALGVDYPEVVVTLSAAAAAGAVALAVTALTGAIPPGTMLNFGVPGLVAYAPNGAAAAAVAIVVRPLEQAIPNGASYTVPARLRRSLVDGTAIGRTYAERDAGTPFGPAAAGDDEVYLLAFPVRDLVKVNDGDVVRAFAGVAIKENYLPGWNTLAAAVQTLIRARYICTVGAQ